MAGELFNLLTDSELVEKIKTDNCSDSLRELSDRHSGLCHRIFRQYIHYTGSCSMSGSEFDSDRARLVYESAMAYEDGKGTKFGTWLGNKIRFHCLNLLSKESKYVVVDDDTMNFVLDNRSASGDESINDGCAYRGCEEIAYYQPFAENSKFIGGFAASDAEALMKWLGDIEDKRLFRVIELRYFSNDKKDMVWAKIAKELNMSIQGVINLHDRAIEKIRDKIKNGELVSSA